MLPTESIGLLVQKKRIIDFQDGGHGGNLGFLIGKILAIFDLQVTPMLPTKFQVFWPLISGEEAKIDFKDGGYLGFPIFCSTSHRDASYQVSSQFAFRFRRRNEK